MKNAFFAIFIVVSLISGAKAQCGEELINIAKRDMKPNEILVKQFQVAFSESWDYKNVVKYAVILSQNRKYRFIIKNSPGDSCKLALKLNYICDVTQTENLNRKLNSVKTNLYKNKKGKTELYETFEYCDTEKSGIYQLILTFTENVEGCAVVLLVSEK